MRDVTSKQRNMGRAAMAITGILWGLAGVCVKSVTWSAMSLMASRSVLSLLILFVAKGSFKVNFKKENVLSGAMTTCTGILYVLAIKLTTAGTAIVLQYVAPILILVYSILFQKYKAKLSEILIVLAVFGGCVLSFADTLDPTRLLGNLLGLLSGVTFAAMIIIMNGADSDADDCLIISNALSFIICLPFFITDSSVVFDFHNVFWVLVFGIFQYGIANLIFARTIKWVDKIEASLILTLEPITNPIPVAILCGEKMGTLATIGFIMVIVFVTLYILLPTIEKRFGRKDIEQ